MLEVQSGRVMARDRTFGVFERFEVVRVDRPVAASLQTPAEPAWAGQVCHPAAFEEGAQPNLLSGSLRSPPPRHRRARRRQLPCIDSHKGWTDESDPAKELGDTPSTT